MQIPYACHFIDTGFGRVHIHCTIQVMLPVSATESKHACVWACNTTHTDLNKAPTTSGWIRIRLCANPTVPCNALQHNTVRAFTSVHNKPLQCEPPQFTAIHVNPLIASGAH